MSRPTRDGPAARALYARVDSKATGKLAVGAGAVEVAVHLLNGEIVGATSPDDLRQVIRLLVASGAIEKSAAEGYEALVEEGGDVFGALLVLGQTFDNALVDRFRQNLSDYLSSVSAPRFFEQKTVFVENLQMGHDSRSLVDELCAVCDLAKAVDVDNLVVRGPGDPGPDALRQHIARLVGSEPRTISSLLHEIPAEPIRARVAIGAMLQSRVLTPPGLNSLPPGAQPGANAQGTPSLPTSGLSPDDTTSYDTGRSGDDSDLMDAFNALEEDETAAGEQTRALPRMGGTPVPPSRSHSFSSGSSGQVPRTPGAPPPRDMAPGPSSSGSRTRGRSTALSSSLPGRPPRPEIVRSDARAEAARAEGGRSMPLEGVLEPTRELGRVAIPELADFEIRTEEFTPEPASFQSEPTPPELAYESARVADLERRMRNLGLGPSFSMAPSRDLDEDEDVEDARTEQIDRRVYASSGSLSDWLNRTDAVVDDDLFSDHDYQRGGASDGRFRTDSHNLEKLEVVGIVDDEPTGEAPLPERRTEPEGEVEVIEADEASLDSPVIKYGAPVLTHGDAIAKVEVANEVLSIVAQAFDEAHGPGRGRAVLQLLVDGAPGTYASLLHNLKMDDAGELPTEQVIRNLQSRPATEHRQLLNNGLVDLIERALSSAADELPEEAFDEVLGSVAGYRQRLGL